MTSCKTAGRIGICLLLMFLAACSSKPSEEVKLGGIALTDVLDGLMIRLNQAVNGLSSGASGQATLDNFAAINDGLEDLSFHAPKLSPAGQDELAKKATGHLPTVVQLAQAVNRSPLARDLGPVMDEMVTRMNYLTMPPFEAWE